MRFQEKVVRVAREFRQLFRVHKGEFEKVQSGLVSTRVHRFLLLPIFSGGEFLRLNINLRVHYQKMRNSKILCVIMVRSVNCFFYVCLPSGIIIEVFPLMHLYIFLNLAYEYRFLWLYLILHISKEDQGSKRTNRP